MGSGIREHPLWLMSTTYEERGRDRGPLLACWIDPRPPRGEASESGDEDGLRFPALSEMHVGEQALLEFALEYKLS